MYFSKYIFQCFKIKIRQWLYNAIHTLKKIQFYTFRWVNCKVYGLCLSKVVYFEKDTDAGKYWGREEKGTTEDEMVGWHHRLNGDEFE